MDIMSFFSEYMIPVAVVICLIVGYILKNYVKVVPNNLIPIIVTVLGIALAAWVNMAMNPDILAAGMVSGLASTGLHQLLTRTLENIGGGASAADSDDSSDDTNAVG